MYKNRLSESHGVRVAVRVVVLAGITAGVAAGFGSTAAIIVFAAGLVLGLLLELRPDRAAAHPLREAAGEGAPHDERHVLVVANTMLHGEELAKELAGPGIVDVLAPPLPSAVHLAVTDIDHELTEARMRLNASLAWAVDHGIYARGEVGDADVTAGIADELRGFGADEVVVVTKAGEGRRITRRELDRLRADLDVPVREIAI
jgi:hypothetical protein